MSASKRLWVSVLVAFVAFIAAAIFGNDGAVSPALFAFMAAGLTYLQLWSYAVRDRRRRRRPSG